MRKFYNLPATAKKQLMSIPAKYASFGAMLGAALVSNSAFAQASGADGLQSAISTELSGAKPVLYAIGGLILGAIAVLVVIRLAKRGANS